MTAIPNPFDASFTQAGEQLLAGQRQVLAWQRSQLKLAEDTSVAAFKLGQSSFETSAQLGQNVVKTLLDSVPTTAKPTAEKPTAG
jgi:hypothetical protein